MVIVANDNIRFGRKISFDCDKYFVQIAKIASLNLKLMLNVFRDDSQISSFCSVDIRAISVNSRQNHSLSLIAVFLIISTPLFLRSLFSLAVSLSSVLLIGPGMSLAG